jgi:hypothetical protein
MSMENLHTEISYTSDATLDQGLLFLAPTVTVFALLTIRQTRVT